MARLCPEPPTFPAIKTINPASSAPRLPGAAHATLCPHNGAPITRTVTVTCITTITRIIPITCGSHITGSGPDASSAPARLAQPREEALGAGE